MPLSQDQAQNFVSQFQQASGNAIKELNKLQEILSYGAANGLLSEGGITPEDLLKSSHEGMEISELLAAAQSVLGVVEYLQTNNVYASVAPILSGPPLS